MHSRQGRQAGEHRFMSLHFAACPYTRHLDSPVTSGLWLTQMRLVLRSLSRPGVMAAVGTLDAMI